MEKLPILLILTILPIANFREETNEDGKCKTQDKRDGFYKKIKNCPPILANFENKDKTYNSPIPEIENIVCCPKEKRIKERMASLLPSVCGQVYVNEQTSRIVGGKRSRPGAWPWVVAIAFRARHLGPFWLCGGALVTRSSVVTAAHCKYHPQAKMYKVRVGDIHLSSDPALRPHGSGHIGFEIPIMKVISHQGYNRGQLLHDVAVLKLAFPVTFSEYIQPICLPLPEMLNLSFEGYLPTAAGWGATKYRGNFSMTLNEVQLPVVKLQTCIKAFKQRGTIITPTHICAGYAEGRKDACQGDSGGPLMLPYKNSYYLIGVSSYGYKCAVKGYPGVFTRITDYINWILYTIDYLERSDILLYK